MGKLVDNRLTNISSMLVNSSLSNGQNYQKYSVGLLQEKMNRDWQYASNVFTIQEEMPLGNQIYQDLKIRITHVIQSDTNDMKLGDDYRGIEFSDTTHKTGLGYLYKFDNSYWLCMDSDIYRYSTMSITVRRMNNTLNWYEKQSDGSLTLYQEPCALPNELTRDIPKFDDVTLPDGQARVITQMNERTKKIQENQRFIFNGKPYKVQSIVPWMRQETMNNDSVTILKLNMYIDEKNAMDDIEHNIAGGLAYTQNQPPTPSPTTSVITYSPTNLKIKLNNTVTYTVNKYVNNVANSDTFTFTVNDVPLDYYGFSSTDGNHFTVTCKQRYTDGRLVIHCVDNVTNETLDMKIMLAGMI